MVPFPCALSPDTTHITDSLSMFQHVSYTTMCVCLCMWDAGCDHCHRRHHNTFTSRSPLFYHSVLSVHLHFYHFTVLITYNGKVCFLSLSGSARCLQNERSTSNVCTRNMTFSTDSAISVNNCLDRSQPVVSEVDTSSSRVAVCWGHKFRFKVRLWKWRDWMAFELM